jgi:hypothetical protein
MLPPTTGFSTGILKRDVASSGVELDATVRLIDRHAVRWELRGIGATQSNHVIGGSTISGTDRSEIADGQPIWGNPSFIATFNDSNGDGILSDSEISTSVVDKDLGSPTPTFEGALHSIVSFGGRVSLSAVVDRRSGFVSRPGSMVAHCRFLRCRNAQDPSATIEEQAEMLTQYRGYPVSTDASFTRLREISLRLSLSPALARAGALRDAAIVVAGRDLYTWTSWKGLDPEINTYARAAIVRSDVGGVPLPRRVMIGVELGGGGR